MSQEILSLRRNAEDLEILLLGGQIVRHGESFIALPREVIPFAGVLDSVVFELIRPQDLNPPSRWFIGFQAVRPESLGMILGPCIAVFLYSLIQGWNVSLSVALSSLFGASLIQIAVNLLNDVEDHLRLIDLPGTLGGSGVIQRGWVSAKIVRRVGYCVLASGVAFGLPAVVHQPPLFFLICALGAAGALAYSSRPFGIKYTPWGDVAVFLLFGPLLSLGFSLAIAGHGDLGIGWLGCFYGFISWAVIHARNLQDIESDRAHGVVTAAAWMGFAASRFFYVALYGLAGLALAGWGLAGKLPWFAMAPALVAIPILIQTFRRLFKASGPASALLSQIRFDTTRMIWILSGLVIFGLFLALSSK